MRFSLLPKAIYPALTSVDLQDLHRQGIRLLMLDFDNTIVPYTTNVPTPRMRRWLAGAKASPVRICVVSNSKKRRVVEFCNAQGIDCVTHAKKPRRGGITRCMKRYGMEPGECALCGDQIFTDVLGANRSGIRSLLVPAIDNHNIWLKLRHVLEIPFIFFAKGRTCK